MFGAKLFAVYSRLNITLAEFRKNLVHSLLELKLR